MTMQGTELKALRQDLGLSQQEFADAIGMSRKAVNEMEGGKTPIEKRTALAAEAVYQEQAPLYGRRDPEPSPDDIPLIDAMILWDDELEVDPAVVVVGRGEDDQRYISSYGSCNSDWRMAGDAGRLLRLFSRFHELTVEHGIKPATVHRAFLVIPEYRAAVSMGTLPESGWGKRAPGHRAGAHYAANIDANDTTTSATTASKRP